MHENFEQPHFLELWLQLINGSPVCNVDILAGDYLVVPCRLGMVQVVH
jgi:hypothetical protein